MLVSVIMPAYNCGAYIEQSVQSVLAQTVTDWELQIVDDGSVDQTARVLQPYLDKYPNIHYCRFARNRGPAAARTEAIKRSSGKYAAFLDSDDLWLPGKLEKQISFMEETGARFSCTAYRHMDAEGRVLRTVIVPPEKTSYQKCLLLSNPIGNLTAMYDQEALGKFEVPEIGKRNDFALWLQVLKKTSCCYGMREVLGVYRVARTGALSRRKLEQAKYHWQLYRGIERHGVARSVWELGCWAVVKGTGIGLDRRRV